MHLYDYVYFIKVHVKRNMSYEDHDHINNNRYSSLYTINQDCILHTYTHEVLQSQLAVHLHVSHLHLYLSRKLIKMGMFPVLGNFKD